MSQRRRWPRSETSWRCLVVIEFPQERLKRRESSEGGGGGTVYSLWMQTRRCELDILLYAFGLFYCDRSKTHQVGCRSYFQGTYGRSIYFFLDLSSDSEHFESVGELRRKHKEGDISPKYLRLQFDVDSALSKLIYRAIIST